MSASLFATDVSTSLSVHHSINNHHKFPSVTFHIFLYIIQLFYIHIVPDISLQYSISSSTPLNLIKSINTSAICYICIFYMYTRRLVLKKTVFSAWKSTLNMGLINKVDMVCLSPVGYGV